MAIVYNSNRIVLDKLVLHVDIANKKSYPGSGVTYFDMSGQGYHGTFGDGAGSNAPTVDDTTFPGQRHLLFAQSGTTAIAFPESNISKDPSLYLGETTGRLTYEAWVYSLGDGSGSLYRIMSTDFSDYTGLAVRKDGASSATPGHNRVEFQINPNNAAVGTRFNFTSDADYFNKWFHIVGTYDGGTGKRVLYINGEAKTTGTTSLTEATYGDDTARPFAISSNVEGTVQFNNGWYGYIDICRIYGKALSADEVLQNYNAQKARFGL
jgi:hypothetical protein